MGTTNTGNKIISLAGKCLVVVVFAQLMSSQLASSESAACPAAVIQHVQKGVTEFFSGSFGIDSAANISSIPIEVSPSGKFDPKDVVVACGSDGRPNKISAQPGTFLMNVQGRLSGQCYKSWVGRGWVKDAQFEALQDILIEFTSAQSLTLSPGKLFMKSIDGMAKVSDCEFAADCSSVIRSSAIEKINKLLFQEFEIPLTIEGTADAPAVTTLIKTSFVKKKLGDDAIKISCDAGKNDKVAEIQLSAELTAEAKGTIDATCPVKSAAKSSSWWSYSAWTSSAVHYFVASVMVKVDSVLQGASIKGDVTQTFTFKTSPNCGPFETKITNALTAEIRKKVLATLKEATGAKSSDTEDSSSPAIAAKKDPTQTPEPDPTDIVEGRHKRVQGEKPQKPSHKGSGPPAADADDTRGETPIVTPKNETGPCTEKMRMRIQNALVLRLRERMFQAEATEDAFDLKVKANNQLKPEDIIVECIGAGKLNKITTVSTGISFELEGKIDTSCKERVLAFHSKVKGHPIKATATVTFEIRKDVENMSVKTVKLEMHDENGSAKKTCKGLEERIRERLRFNLIGTMHGRFDKKGAGLTASIPDEFRGATAWFNYCTGPGYGEAVERLNKLLLEAVTTKHGYAAKFIEALPDESTDIFCDHDKGALVVGFGTSGAPLKLSLTGKFAHKCPTQGKSWSSMVWGASNAFDLVVSSNVRAIVKSIKKQEGDANSADPFDTELRETKFTFSSKICGEVESILKNEAEAILRTRIADTLFEMMTTGLQPCDTGMFNRVVNAYNTNNVFGHSTLPTNELKPVSTGVMGSLFTALSGGEEGKIKGTFSPVFHQILDVLCDKENSTFVAAYKVKKGEAITASVQGKFLQKPGKIGNAEIPKRLSIAVSGSFSFKFFARVLERPANVMIYPQFLFYGHDYSKLVQKPTTPIVDFVQSDIAKSAHSFLQMLMFSLEHLRGNLITMKP